MNILWVILACVASGVLYRMGGKGKPFNTKHRDLGCPTVLLLLTWLLFGFSWWFFLAFGLAFADLTTYWDFLFGYDNYYAHGFFCGLAGLPLMVVVPWPILVARLIICTVGMGLWSKAIKNAVLEETGRGVLFIL